MSIESTAPLPPIRGCVLVPDYTPVQHDDRIYDTVNKQWQLGRYFLCVVFPPERYRIYRPKTRWGIHYSTPLISFPFVLGKLWAAYWIQRGEKALGILHKARVACEGRRRKAHAERMKHSKPLIYFPAVVLWQWSSWWLNRCLVVKENLRVVRCNWTRRLGNKKKWPLAKLVLKQMAESQRVKEAIARMDLRGFTAEAIWNNVFKPAATMHGRRNAFVGIQRVECGGPREAGAW